VLITGPRVISSFHDFRAAMVSRNHREFWTESGFSFFSPDSARPFGPPQIMGRMWKGQNPSGYAASFLLEVARRAAPAKAANARALKGDSEQRAETNDSFTKNGPAGEFLVGKQVTSPPRPRKDIQSR